MIAIVGDFLWDRDVYLKTTRQSPEGPWPVVVEDKPIDVRPGGAGAVALMVRGLGWKYLRCGATSKRWSIKERTFVDGKQLFRLDRDDTDPITDAVADRIVSMVPEKAIVLVADYGLGLISDYLWSKLATGNWQVIVDPSRHRPLDFYAGAFAIVPNRREAGVSSVREAKRLCAVLSNKFKCFCIKLDRDGMVAADEKNAIHIPAACDSVVDVTGCGDQTLATIGVGLERKMTWFEACRWANEMAGLKCQQHGATPVCIATHNPVV